MPSTRLETIPLIAGNIPTELRMLPRWVLFRIENRKDEKGQEKPTKVPYQPNGHKAATTNPKTWVTFEQAAAAAQGFDGIGFVLGEGYTGIDLDKCVDAKTSIVEDWAQTIIDTFATYAELSCSGTGVHLILKGALPREFLDRDNQHGRRKGAIEIYDGDRYFVMTGNVAGNCKTIEERQDELTAFLTRLFPPPAPKPKRQALSSSSGSLSDHDLLDKAMNAKNGAAFSLLWNGDTSAHSGDDSAADLALCCHLAFWTGNDEAAIDRLFRQSGLYREKWDRDDYRERTISKAVASTSETYPDSCRPRSAPTNGTAHSIRKVPGPVGIFQPTPRPAAADDAWEDPVPFGGTDLPRFPMNSLPSPVREYVAEVSASRQVPEDMAAMMALTVTSAAGARRCEIRIGDTHTETLNLYCAVVMQPGSRKSGTLEDFAIPLREYERELSQERFGTYQVEKERHKQQSMRIDVLRTKASRLDNEFERLVLQREAEDLAANQVEVTELPRLLADDVTMERLAGLLAEQEDNTMCILSAEGDIFALAAGRYNNGSVNIAILLKGHGGESAKVDRVGQPPKFVERPTITIGLAVQPDVLQSLADNKSFRGQGLLGRFLYSIPPNMVGSRLYVNRPVSPEAHRAYCSLIDGLLRLPSLATKERPGLRHTLVIEGIGLDIWQEYYNHVERLQAEGETLAGISDWASKLAGAVARIAGNLHLIKNASRLAPWTFPVAAETVAEAWAIGEYLIPHALAAFSQIGTDTRHALAQRLLKWIPRFIQREGRTYFSARDCHRDMAKSASPDEITLALGALAERGYVRLQEAERTGATGRKPGPVYAIHPDLLKPSDVPKGGKTP